jgi:hypothetical protein
MRTSEEGYEPTILTQAEGSPGSKGGGDIVTGLKLSSNDAKSTLRQTVHDIDSGAKRPPHFLLSPPGAPGGESVPADTTVALP